MKNLIVVLTALLLCSATHLHAQVDKRFKRQPPPKAIPQTKIKMPSADTKIPVLLDEKQAKNIKNNGFFQEGGKTYTKLRNVRVSNQSQEYHLSARKLIDGSRWLSGICDIDGSKGEMTLHGSGFYITVKSLAPSEKALYLVEISLTDLHLGYLSIREEERGADYPSVHFSINAENKVIFLFEANKQNKGSFTIFSEATIRSIRLVKTDTLLDY